jgi:four helix bundle protein
MATVQSFRELVVWQRAIQLAVAVYKLSGGFPRDEAYGLTAQIRRASVRIASNIAEGQGRATTGESRHFLGNAGDRTRRCRLVWCWHESLGWATRRDCSAARRYLWRLGIC